MLQLILLCGLPGTGKTTATGPYRTMDDWFVYSTDDYIESKAYENGQLYDDAFRSLIKDAKKHMDQQLRSAIEQGKHVVWDQTNLTRKKRQAALSLFDTYNKTCWYFPLYIARYGAWMNRLQSRNGKTITVSVINDMVNRFEIPTLADGFDKLVYKNTGLEPESASQNFTQ